MSTILTKNQAVLHRITIFGDVEVVFATDDTEREQTIPWDVWEDMGRPESITVTIEPGDRLNDDDPQPFAQCRCENCASGRGHPSPQLKFNMTGDPVAVGRAVHAALQKMQRRSGGQPRGLA